MPWPTNPEEQYFGRGGWGWDGTAWRKLPLTWGYTDRYAEIKSNLNCVAGVNYLSFAAVPAGEVWKVTAITFVNTVTDPGVAYATLYDGSTAFNIYSKSSPGANVYVSVVCDVTLKAGDRIRVGFNGCASNDDIYAWVIGSKMAVG